MRFNLPAVISSVTSSVTKSLVEAGFTLSDNLGVNVLRVAGLGLAVNVMLLSAIQQKLLEAGVNAAILAILTSLGFSLPAGVLVLKLAAIHRGKKVAEELRYFIVSESVIAEASPNLIDDLSSCLEWGDIFPTLAKDGKIFSLLRKFYTVHETVRIYGKWVKSEEVRSILNDYLFSANMGTVKEWLQLRGRELFENIRRKAKEVMSGRLTYAVIIAVVLGYTPPLLVALTPLVGSQYTIKVLGSLLLVLPVAFVTLPKLPPHMKIQVNGKWRIPVIMGAAGLSCYGFYESQTIAPLYLLATSAIFFAVGVYSTLQWIMGFSEITWLNRILSKLYEVPLAGGCSVGIIKDVISSSGCRTWSRIGKALSTTTPLKHVITLKGWISKLSLRMILNGLKYGSLSREGLLRMTELVSASIHDLKDSAATSLVTAGIALALPFLMASMKNLAAAIPPIIDNYIVVASLGYSLFSSYVLFDDPLNTLLPGITGFEILLGALR
ncbi:MAG: hypothetical protein J7L55_00745 [Desulfurococcales archaeon]|nr:hypothetical protein [Desulfurococcales archaeon]